LYFDEKKYYSSESTIHAFDTLNKLQTTAWSIVLRILDPEDRPKLGLQPSTLEFNLVQREGKTIFIIEVTQSNYLPHRLKDIKVLFEEYPGSDFKAPRESEAMARLSFKLLQLERQCLFMSVLSPYTDQCAALCSPSFTDLTDHAMNQILSFLFESTIFVHATPSLCNLYRNQRFLFLSW